MGFKFTKPWDRREVKKICESTLNLANDMFDFVLSCLLEGFDARVTYDEDMNKQGSGEGENGQRQRQFIRIVN